MRARVKQTDVMVRSVLTKSILQELPVAASLVGSVDGTCKRQIKIATRQIGQSVHVKALCGRMAEGCCDHGQQ